MKCNRDKEEVDQIFNDPRAIISFLEKRSRAISFFFCKVGKRNTNNKKRLSFRFSRFLYLKTYILKR